jgi:hypothetical protein
MGKETGAQIKDHPKAMIPITRRTIIAAFFEAVKSGMAKIPTAIALQEYAAHRSHPANLGRG